MAALVAADRAARPAEQPAERVRVKVAEAMGSNPITSTKSPVQRLESGIPQKIRFSGVSLRVFTGPRDERGGDM